MTTEQITRYVEEDPLRPGPSHAPLVDAGVEVWALVGYYQHAAGGDQPRVARDYAVPEAAVQAALDYYRRHKKLIDAQIARNAA
jgi:uncharacterized protein (DUF433 family)